MSTASALAAEVRAEMARQRRTGIELAAHLQCSQQSVSRRLTGQMDFSTDELASTAAWLGIDLATLANRAHASLGASA